MGQNILDSLKNKFKNKKVLVVGLGLQGGGVGMAKFFSELGSIVTVTDKKNERQLVDSIKALKDFEIKFTLGRHDIADFLESDFIFKGPSVLWTEPEIKAAQDKGIPVEMELSFFAANFPGKIIGITGTRGKSTTTQMIYNLLKLSGFSVYLGGGLPGISTINYLKTLTEKDWVVMEISSWALAGFHRNKISPHIAVFTNIYPDHLNYYSNMDEYLYDKKAIYLYQKENDYLVINESLTLTDKMKSKVIKFKKTDFPYKLNILKGDHNLENSAAAFQVAKILKIDEKKALKIITGFSGMPFRQQIINKKNNVIFINDTTSTTPIATIKAIESFDDKPIYLILGGNSKNLPIGGLFSFLKKVNKIILLDGSFTKEIMVELKKLFQDKLVGPFDDLEIAIKTGYQSARQEKKECYLLFSPGATSFAMFNNEFHRGKEFNRIVDKLL